MPKTTYGLCALAAASFVLLASVSARTAFAQEGSSSSYSWSSNSSFDSSTSSDESSSYSSESSESSSWSSSSSSESSSGCYFWWWCGSSSSSSYSSESSESSYASSGNSSYESSDSSSSDSSSSDLSSSSSDSSESSSSSDSSSSSSDSSSSDSSESSSSDSSENSSESSGSSDGYIYGCTDPQAANYNSNATADDGSCYCAEPEGLGGCTHPDAVNYDPDADYDDGSCEFAPVCQIGTPDPSDDITPLQPTNMCGGTMDGTVVGIFGAIAGVIERLNDLEKSCKATWDSYSTAMPGVTEDHFMKRCRHYSHHCNSFAKNHTDIPDGPWGDANEGVVRHRCVIAGLACEFGNDVAQAWGEEFEVFGGDCDFRNNAGKCPPITLADHTTWAAGDPAEQAALADSCRDIANNNSALSCMSKMCASYYTNGNLVAETWHPLTGTVKVCCELTILGQPAPRNKAGTCSQHYCQQMAEGIAKQEKDVYELYQKVPGPPAKYVLGIMPGTAGGFCAGY